MPQGGVFVPESHGRDLVPHAAGHLQHVGRGADEVSLVVGCVGRRAAGAVAAGAVGDEAIAVDADGDRHGFDELFALARFALHAVDLSAERIEAELSGHGQKHAELHVAGVAGDDVLDDADLFGPEGPAERRERVCGRDGVFHS